MSPLHIALDFLHLSVCVYVRACVFVYILFLCVDFLVAKFTLYKLPFSFTSRNEVLVNGLLSVYDLVGKPAAI